MSDKPFFLRVPYPVLMLVYSAGVFVSLHQLQRIVPAKAAFEWYWVIQLLAVVTSLLIHQRLAAAAQVSGQVFVRTFMLTSALKLFAFMVVMVIYAVLNREQAFGFIFNFLIIYLLYTVVEVWVSFKVFGPSKAPKTIA